MEFTIELPGKYARRLEEIEKVEPTIREQIEIDVLPRVLRLIEEAHRQLRARDREEKGGGSAEP